MAKLMTNNQGVALALKGRKLGVTCADFQKALNDGRAAEFLNTLLPRDGAVVPVRSLPTWKTTRVGTHKTADAFRAACKAAGIRISAWEYDLLGKIVFPADLIEEDVEFVRASNQDLGLTKGATKEDTEKRALELGLLKCMPWDGPAIREAYPNQPLGEWFLVMMDAITDSNGYLNVFEVVRNDGGLWLGASSGRPGYFRRAGSVWLFRRKKSSPLKL